MFSIYLFPQEGILLLTAWVRTIEGCSEIFQPLHCDATGMKCYLSHAENKQFMNCFRGPSQQLLPPEVFWELLGGGCGSSESVCVQTGCQHGLKRCPLSCFMEGRLLWRTDSSWHSGFYSRLPWLRQCWVFLCIIYTILKGGVIKIAVLQEHFDLIVKSRVAQVEKLLQGKKIVLFLLVFWKRVERWVVFSAGLSLFIPAPRVPGLCPRCWGGLAVDRDVRRMLQMSLSSPWLPVFGCNWLWYTRPGSPLIPHCQLFSHT